MKCFQNQVAIITGAASGLGLAIATRLSSEGVKLALIDLNEEKLMRSVSQYGSEVKAYVLDITDENQVEITADHILKHFGKIDILVNSAGITGKTNIHSHRTDTADVRKVFEVNYYGSYFTSKYVLPFMLQQQYGRVLHIASISPLLVFPAAVPFIRLNTI